MFGIEIILIIFAVAGVVAFVGNFVGRYFGRRRLTLFGLRPRYTATIFTIITGILIAAVTFAILVGISEDVRIALFGIERLKSDVLKKGEALTVTRLAYEKELKEKTELRKKLEKEFKADINDLKDEKAQLSKDIEGLRGIVLKLEKGIVKTRRGTVLYKINEPILTTMVEGGGDKAAAAKKVKVCLSMTDSIIRRAGYVSTDKKVVYFPPDEYEQALVYVQARNKASIVVRVTAAQNIVAGEVAPVHFEMFENSLVFRKGDEITSGLIESKLTQPEIEQKLKTLLTHVNEIAMNKGVIPDAAGHVGDVSYSQVTDIAAKIKKQRGTVNLHILAAEDTYNIGPLLINFSLNTNHGT